MTAAFDLFGHGPQDNLPGGDTVNYTNGPDRRKGPGRCRGHAPQCDKWPHDHSCKCCSPCRHARMNICDGGGCKCVPKAICATFTPDTPTTDCTALSFYASAVEVPVYGAGYTFALPGGVYSLFVGLDQYDGLTKWKLLSGSGESEVVLDEVVIDHSGYIHCQAPPDFTVTGVNAPYTDDLGSHDCFGTLTFSAADQQTVPFVRRWQGVAETTAVACGACDSVCTILCVRRGTAGVDAYSRVDFSFDSYTGRWSASDDSGHHFSLTEVDGTCFLSMDNMPGTFDTSLIEIDPYHCAVGMNLRVDDYETGDWIAISCNKCSCWDYVCGNCRCVCKSLCYVGSDGTDVITGSLPWSVDDIAWTDGVDTAGLVRTNAGNCKLSFTGFDESQPITNDCGDQIATSFSRPMEDAQTLGAVKWRAVFCRNCSACNAGTCLSDCEAPPPVIWCDLEADTWTPMLGCDDEVLCFPTVSFPMLLRFVQSELAPAGEWRWYGSVIILCHDCDTGGVDDTPRNFVVQADLGCDGQLLFRVQRHDSSNPFSETFSITIPCDDLAWEQTFSVRGSAGVPLGCCNVGGYKGTLTLGV